jgi:transposase-like protein
MTPKRRTFSNEFKAKVALEAIREQDTVQQIAIRHQIAPAQVSQWKKQALESMASGFSRETERGAKQEDWERKEAQMYRKIGQLVPSAAT